MAEMVAPSWVNANFIQEALRQGGGDDADAVVTSVSLKPLGNPGDYYCSIMFRVAADTTKGTRPLIVKTVPPGEMQKAMISMSKFFFVERTVLPDIVPKMNRLLEDAAPGRFQPIGARCLHHGDKPDEFLVLEDLEPQGFRLADRHRGLGLRHSLLAVRTLARFHAASVVLLSQDPTLPTKLINPYRRVGVEQVAFIINLSFHTVAETSRKWQDFPSKYADALENIKAKSFNKYQSVHDYRPGRFNVLIHGDFWINNMMFRYEDDQVRDIRLVDLQVSHVTTPALDLLHFLYSSVSENVSKHHRDLLIREYHVALTEAMQLLGLQAPTLKEILAEIEEFGFWGVISTLCMLPLTKVDKDIPNSETAISEAAKGQPMLPVTPTVERWLRRLLPELYDKGLLSPEAVEC